MKIALPAGMRLSHRWFDLLSLSPLRRNAICSFGRREPMDLSEVPWSPQGKCLPMKPAHGKNMP